MGVYRHSSGSNFIASITRGGKDYYIGSFPTKQKAVIAWEGMAEKLPRDKRGRHSISKGKRGMKIKVYGYDGDYIGQYESLSSASEKLKISTSTISTVLNGRQKFGVSKLLGSKVRFEKVEDGGN